MKFYTFGNNLPNGGSGDRWSGVRFWLTTLLVFWAFSTIVTLLFKVAILSLGMVNRKY